jgi:hypothetical protein
VVAAVRAVNRLVLVGETLRHTLNMLATSGPSWLKPHIQADKRFDDYRLSKGKAERAALAGQIGEDGRALLSALLAAESPRWLREIGPVAPDHCWQALTPDAYDVSHFFIDWEAQRVRCPQGHLSHKWSQTHDQQRNPIINVRFAPANCVACPVRTRCTRSPDAPPSSTTSSHPSAPPRTRRTCLSSGLRSQSWH